MTEYQEPTLDQAMAEADAAIERADKAADEAWKDAAMQAVIELARAGTLFTTDDVWFALARAGVDPPREPRALGGLMRRALSGGYVFSTGLWERSKRRHATPIPVYRGTIEMTGVKR